MLLQVNVTQDDINNGKRGKCSKCPIALAISRELRKKKLASNKVNVMGAMASKCYSSVAIKARGKWYAIDRDNISWGSIPSSALTFVRDFDSGKKVDLIQFELNLVPV